MLLYSFCNYLGSSLNISFFFKSTNIIGDYTITYFKNMSTYWEILKKFFSNISIFFGKKNSWTHFSFLQILLLK